MKKLFSFALALMMLFALCVPAFAASLPNEEDTVYYGNSDAPDVCQIPYAIVDVPDEAKAVAAEEDTVYYGINQLNPEDFIRVSPATVGTARSSYIRLEFGGTMYDNLCSDFIENVIKAGATASLKVDTCVWAPETNDLEIGIYNWSTAENWYVVKSGGKVSNYSKKFTNLTAGTYSVYILNRGKNTLTTGYMLYTLT